MQLAPLTQSCLVDAWLYAQRVAIPPETALRLVCNVRPTTSLCHCFGINPFGRVGSRFNYLVVNKDRRLNEQGFAGLQTVIAGVG